MKKPLAFLAALLMMFVCANALHNQAEASGDGLKLTDPLQGIWKPAEQLQASFPFVFPQFEENHPAAGTINHYYRFLAESEFPIEISPVSMTYEIASNSQQYLSVLHRFTVESGQGESERIWGRTFAVDGMYSGNVIGLTQVLGLEQQAADSVAVELVYELIWQIVERNAQNAEGDYLDGLSCEQLRLALQPEWDFYLDQDGNIVFYIQPGEISGEIAGVLLFPFLPSELLSALQ